ncbi:MAG TPA: xanthine dehydrogenase family protein molybdopterin-binding subunit [Candidatus Sulfotelmatobacter sp.]|nr:xanthine dehydrogenase family protein molybdopterin-binding subunit [Candidatus Sulfotelmatobacter sp.]
MKVVGEPLPRPDARAKVTGAALYPADLVRPEMLHCKAVFAHRAHARIERIDTAAARALDGVVDVFVAGDVPYNRYGLIDADQEVLCSEVVRYVGDRVALVVAVTPEIATRAAALVEVAYHDLPIVVDAHAAIADGAPLVHPGHGTNVLLHQKIRHGDVAAGFAASDIVVAGTFTTSWQEHAYLQPDAGIAYYEGVTLVVETAGQWLHEDLRQVAAMLRLNEDQVAIRYAKIGGAFGGREDLSVQALVALATWKTKRPTAIVWSREESIVGHHKRHPFHIEAKWGAKRDGTIVAVQTRLLADGGAYASTSVEVLKGAAIFAHGPYRTPNVATDGIVVFTNNPPSGAFRGFGSPQAHWAAESMIARVAQALELDPVEIRRKNLYREGDREPTGSVLPEGVTAVPVLDACAQEAASRFVPRVARGEHGRLRRGIGIASGIKNVGYSFGFPEQSTATVELIVTDRIERALVRSGVADVGQGVHLIVRQIAAETLGLPLDAVALISDDSAEAPNAGSASASRLTVMAGRAVHDAALAARAAWQRGEAPAATVQFRPPPTTPLDLETGQGRPCYSYGYAAQAVEVEVDVTTGVTRVLKIISAHDVGRAINTQQVEAQIEGCLAQALGYALTENFLVREGKVLTPHFSSYLLPTALDMPTEVVPLILELGDPIGAFGSRGMAEMPLVPFAPAVAAAIYDATGAWVDDLPMTPERILAAITKVRRASAAAVPS